MSPFFWGSGFGIGFGMFEVIFTLMFFLVFGTFIFVFVKGIREWNKNNHSPKLTVDATIVSKRNHTSHHHHNNHVSHSTSYYVTFQVESGDRMEFHVGSTAYGMLSNKKKLANYPFTMTDEKFYRMFKNSVHIKKAKKFSLFGKK